MINQDYVLLIFNCVKYRHKALKQKDTWIKGGSFKKTKRGKITKRRKITKQLKKVSSKFQIPRFKKAHPLRWQCGRC